MIIPYGEKIPKIHESVFIAEGSFIIGDVEIDENCSIWFNCVIRGDVNFIRIGRRTNIQDGAILHVTRERHPLIIGNNVSIGHGAILHGCRIGNDVLIGIGAIVLDGVTIGDGSIIGAGSVVAEGTVIPPNSVFMGIPAQFKKEVSEKDRERISTTARNYLNYAAVYLKARQTSKITGSSKR